MKAYIIPSGIRISPFNEDAGNLLIGNRSLRQIQHDVLTRCGLEPVFVEDHRKINDEEFILTLDNVFFTKRVLKDFYRRSKRLGVPTQLSLPESFFTEKFNLLQGNRIHQQNDDSKSVYGYDLFYIKRPTQEKLYSLIEFILEALARGKSYKVEGDKNQLDSIGWVRPIACRYREKRYLHPVPPNMCGTPYFEHPVTSSVIIHINHWIHLLWANLLSIQIRWIETVSGNWFWAILRLLESLSLSRSAMKWKLMRNFNRRGSGCDIHPTALVELSIIGNGVKVGAHSIVRGSIIGDGTVIEERAFVNFSVIGEGCFISKNSTIVASCGFPHSDLCCNGMQLCLVGRRCALTAYMRPIDLKYRGEVKVKFGDRYVPTGSNMLGSCFGHRCFIGPDVYIQPGREVPSDTTIIKHPSQILSRIPPAIKGQAPFYVEDGTLKKYRRET
jgi:acetyltransferase-like isoleucine patch superfamily enzyme